MRVNPYFLGDCLTEKGAAICSLIEPYLDILDPDFATFLQYVKDFYKVKPCRDHSWIRKLDARDKKLLSLFLARVTYTVARVKSEYINAPKKFVSQYCPDTLYCFIAKDNKLDVFLRRIYESCIKGKVIPEGYPAAVGAVIAPIVAETVAPFAQLGANVLGQYIIENRKLKEKNTKVISWQQMFNKKQDNYNNNNNPPASYNTNRVQDTASKGKSKSKWLLWGGIGVGIILIGAITLWLIRKRKANQ